MKNAIILHGKPPEARYNNPELPKPHEANWLPWLSRGLGEAGVDVSILALTKPYFPVYIDWKSTLESCKIDKNTGFVTHSASSELVLRWASENPERELDSITMVAPYRDEAGKYGDFSDYVLDKSLVERVGRITIFSSLDDSEPIQRRANQLAEELPGSELIELNGFGHFMLGNNMKTNEFPQLLSSLTE